MRRHAESAGRAERMLGAVMLAQALTLVVSGPSSSPEYLPLRVADAEGYFAKEGLAVTLRTTRAEPGAAEALAQGQADLVATSVEAILRFGPRVSKQAPARSRSHRGATRRPADLRRSTVAGGPRRA